MLNGRGNRNENPRVAAVVSYFPTRAEPHSGMPFLNQMRAMASIADVRIFVVRPRYPDLRVLGPKTFRDAGVDATFTIPGMQVTYLTYPALPMVSRPFNGHLCANSLLSAVRVSAADVLLSYIVYPVGYASVRVARKLGLPAVVGATGSDVRCIPDRWTRRLVKATLRDADFVVAKSDELRGQAIRLGAAAGKVRAIHNGCDSTIFHRGDRTAARAQLGVSQSAKLVVFTGRLVAVKGLGELITALKQLRAPGEELKLVLIGDGPLETELRSRCREAGLLQAVRFTGALGPAEVAVWLRAADVFCLPSYSEGCPNVILEALACGRPVVASHVGGIPEIVDSGCAILVPPSDAGALAAALREALRRQWDEAAIAVKNGRTWGDMARETYEVCRMVATRGAKGDGAAARPGR